jgi:hypothetical protein
MCEVLINWPDSLDSIVPVARVNQQPPMHQLGVLSTGWAAFFHLVSDVVHHITFRFFADHCTFLFFFWFLGRFSPGHNRTHSYPTHLPTLISTAPTLVLYLLSFTNIPDKYCTNLGTLFIIPY